jgi:hypothetical protein
MTASSSTITSERHVLTDEERTLPTYCPSWCTTDHTEDLEDGATMWQACVHRRDLGDVTLCELRNPVDHRTWREGGGSFDVILEQDPHPDSQGGVNGDPLVRLRVQEGLGFDHSLAQLRMTTGEARVLAAGLLAAAERADVLS